MNQDEEALADFRTKVLQFEQDINAVIVGQARAVRLLTLVVCARGHVLLEGGVGVGKTTLLRAVARGLGGEFERVEGTIDLMPTDLLYHTFLDRDGKPSVNPGPLIRGGEQLAVFFFNEINRARPHVHSLLLRVMAERRTTAFDRTYEFPTLQVFADRNRVEKEETFELPAAARDRFMLEIAVEPPEDPVAMDRLVFDPRFHDADRLIEEVAPSSLPLSRMQGFAEAIQRTIQVSPRLRDYVLELGRATVNPEAFRILIHDTDAGELVEAGASPRALSQLVQVARVHAWLAGREAVIPEDVQAVFAPALAHRIFLRPVYEYRRAELIPDLIGRILKTVAAP